MKIYLQAFDYWDVIEIDKDPITLLAKQALNQIKVYSEEKTKRFKTNICIFFIVLDSIFPIIMVCETTKVI